VITAPIGDEESPVADDREHTDIMLFGTGAFAARIAFDIAATASTPMSLVVVGRNALRADWIRTAARARAAMFARPVSVDTALVDLTDQVQVEQLLTQHRPTAVLQVASRGRVAPGPASQWSAAVATAGLSITTVFQTHLSVVVGRAVAAASPQTYFLNGCYPDVANGLLAGMGIPVTCGIGNVAILSNSYHGLLTATGQLPASATLRVLAHHHNIGPYRLLPQHRPAGSVPPRVWIDDEELDGVTERFVGVQLTPEPVMDISGASGVPILQAMAAHAPWRGHVPGVEGRPGGYPVDFDGTSLRLDLPAGLSEAEAVAYNAQFEAHGGCVVDDGRAVYTGIVRETLEGLSADLAEGFALADFDAVYREMAALREHLEQRPAN